MSSFFDKIPPFFRNKYLLAFFVFLIIILFVDSNNLIERVKDNRKLKQLQQEKEYYINKIESETEKLRELQTDNENLEKFAREQYLMKRANEDLYIISPE